MTPEQYRELLQNGIEECEYKIKYYTEHADVINTAKYRGKKEGLEVALKSFEGVKEEKTGAKIK